jgi:hypothetical protein
MVSMYQKHTLGEHKAIRFLLPETRGECGSLRYRFTVQSLGQVVRFAALSYVWGDPKDCGTIVIEGVSRIVTHNLLIALERIDKILESNVELDICGPMLLWADQLCIDQSNIEERSSQVSMMGSIYSSAEYLFACLGDSDTAADVAFMVDQVAHRIEKDTARYHGLLKIPALGADQLAPYSQFNWTAFHDMLLLPYFSRVWIIQEIGLARRGIVLYGDYHFALDRLMLLLAWLSHPGYRIRQLHGLSGWTTHQIWVSFDAKSRDDAGACMSFDFVDLLSHVSCRYKATDPRDHIFGLLGHPSIKLQSPGQAESGSLIIHPDYNASVETVFLNFAISWLKQTAKPYLFSCVSHVGLPLAFRRGHSSSRRRTLDIPSWCPRWDYNPLGGTRLSIEGARQWYSASAGSRFCFELQSERRLKVKGILYDEIIQTFPSLDELDISVGRQVIPRGANLTIQELLTARKLSYLCGMILQNVTQQSLVNDDDMISTLASTILAGSWDNADTSSNRMAQIANITAILSEARYGHVPANQDDFSLAFDMLESYCKQLNSPNIQGNSVAFIKNAEFTITSRRLCLTKSGCVGLGPAIISPGDICCVISGVNIPYALRPFNHETYLMVGECYLESIMHGEAVRGVDGETLQWYDIILE